MANGTQTVDYDALAKQAGAIQSQPANGNPAGGVDYAALAKQSGSVDYKAPEKPPESFWRTVYDRSGIGALQKLTGNVSQWAKQRAEQAQTATLTNVAKGGPGNPIEAYSPRAGYDLLSHATGLASSFLSPENLAITGGVIAANTNPVTGIPVDAALALHGGYGVAKNARAALKGDPDAVERALLSGSEMAGGAAGTAGQVRGLFGRAATPAPAAPEETAQAKPQPKQATTPGNAQPAIEFGGEGPEATPALPGTPGVGKIAKILGVTDPPPAQLLTKAIKPLASNTGWDAAIAKAAPDMKAAEADLGHPIGGVDDALQAASVAKKGIWKQYAAKLQSASTGEGEAGGMIDGNAVADAMMKAIDKRTTMQNPSLVEHIQKIADTYRRPMGLQEAEDFLQSANNDLHNFYAKNKVGRQVAERDPATGYVVAEADQLRNSLYSKLDEMTGPGAAELKQRYGALSNIENELLRRKNVAARQQPESLAEQIAMARAFGKIAVGTLRGSPSSVLEGTQSLASAKWLKARGLTDNMIARAFVALGEPPASAPVPAGPGPAAAATGAAAATAGTAPKQTETDTGPISELLNYDPAQARQGFRHPLVQDALNRLNPGAATALIKKYGLVDTRKYFKGRNA